jgi:6-phosphogluconate dehydrogenase
MESKGLTVACSTGSYFQLTVTSTSWKGRATGKKSSARLFHEELCRELEKPRKSLLHGQGQAAPVDAFIDLGLPYLEPGDIIIDGGKQPSSRHIPAATM